MLVEKFVWGSFCFFFCGLNMMSMGLVAGGFLLFGLVLLLSAVQGAIG